ncbi:hypothetical protein Tco_1412177 [Tanacetum coccineum]
MNSLLEKWLSSFEGLRNGNHTHTLDLADIYERFIYEDNLILRRYPETKKTLITAPSVFPISTAFFSNYIVQDFQENSDDEADENHSCQNLFHHIKELPLMLTGLCLRLVQFFGVLIFKGDRVV